MKEVRQSASFISFVGRVFYGAYSGDFRRSLQLGPEWTSPTLEPKSLLTGEIPSIVQGIGGLDVFHESET